MTYLQTLFSVFLPLYLLLAAATAFAMVSVNVPIGDWSYDVIDKLTGMGLIQSDLRGTRPITRLEMARLTSEAEARFEEIFESQKDKYPAERWEIIRALINRLQSEFRASLEDLSEGSGPSVTIKPLENVYLTYLYGNNEFDLENDKGQKYGDGFNVRAGFSTHGTFLNHLAYYFSPEYRYTEGLSPAREACSGSEGSEVELLEGYGKLELFNIEVEVGRDSLWWGPGRHGSLILSTNAKPFDLLKFSNPRPVILPWIFRYLGLFKFEAFYSKLEEDRVVPEPEFIGYRFNIKPFPFLELAHSRTIMLCGEGSGVKCVTDLSFSDWMDVFFGGGNQDDLNTNQITGFDIDLNFQNVDRWVPGISSVDIWFEYADETGPYPPNSGFVTGFKLGDLLLKGRTDFIFEYADNVIRTEVGDFVFYANGVYGTGYRYFCDVMGHNMDADAREYYVRLEHFLTPDWVLGLAYTYQDRGIEAAKEEGENLEDFLRRNGMDRTNLEDKQRIDLDFTYQRTDSFLAQAGYRYEKVDDVLGVKGSTQDNHLFWVFLQYSF